VKTGETVLDNVIEFNSKANKGYINSVMYDLMIQVQAEKAANE